MLLPLGQSAYKRRYGREPEVVLLNRFFEQAPNNLETGNALLARPATSLETVMGEGPIRGNFSLPGFFSSNLFTVSGGTLYRYDGTTATAIEGTISDTGSAVRWAASGVGGIQRLFISDGLLLQYYQGAAYQATLTLTPGDIVDDIVVIDGVYYKFSADFSAVDKAVGTLTLTPGAIDNDVIRIGDVYYQWVNSGSPGAGAGTIGSPYLVDNGANDTAAFANMLAAINASGTPGTTYSTGLVAHPIVTATASNATTLSVRAKLAGVAGNVVTTVTATGGADGLAWGSGTLTGGFDTDGSSAHPWMVNASGTDAAALANLRAAINASGVEGTDYIAGVVENPRVFSNQNSALTLTARSRLGGAPSPAINVSVTASGGADGLAWNSGSFIAGPEALYGVEIPDGWAALAIDVVNGYILVVAATTQRVYYIEPGEVTIDGQGFFEAESEPDRLNDIVALGDQAWLIGASTTDVYYSTGDLDAPFARAQGRPFPIGGVQGTCVKVNGRLIIVGVDSTVYMIGDGPNPISTNGIAERVRLAREAERDNP